MYLNVKCNCADFILTVTPKQILNAYKQKPVCPECHTVYKLKPSLTYNKYEYITVPDFPSEV